jgi:uncharacterized protein YkwD
MISIARLAALALLFGTLAGGCPNSDLIDVGGGSALNSGNPAADGQRDATAGLSTSSFSDALTTAFPECTEPVQAAEWRAEILRLVNRERASRGLAPLVRNSTLERQAMQYACEMIQFDFFDHVNPITGSTLGQRAAQFGYDFRVVGENLAAGQGTPEQAFTDWMASPGHRANILDARFTEIGIGVRSGGDYGVYWVQEFGLPATGRVAP